MESNVSLSHKTHTGIYAKGRKAKAQIWYVRSHEMSTSSIVLRDHNWTLNPVNKTNQAVANVYFGSAIYN